jgi:hypothetical protein
VTLVRINSRDLIFQISDGAATPTWLSVSGLTSTMVDHSANEETADTTEYDSAGQYSQFIMQRGKSLKLEGNKKYDSVTAAFDSGQARLDAVAELVGASSVVACRMRYPLQTGASGYTVWQATVSRGEEGGGNNDLVKYGYTLTKCGPATAMAAP